MTTATTPSTIATRTPAAGIDSFRATLAAIWAATPLAILIAAFSSGR